MSLTLSPEMERLIHEKVESGMYLSPSDVVETALRLLHEHDQLEKIRLEELRKEIAVGLEELNRGESSPLGARATLAGIREGKARARGIA